MVSSVPKLCPDILPISLRFPSKSAGFHMANIQKRERKNGTIFRVQVRIKGFPVQSKSFKRLTDAKMWAQQTEASIRKGEFQNVIKTAGKKTLGEVITRYRKEVLPRKSEGTQRAEKTHLDFWEAAFGEYALSNIETDKIEERMVELEAQGYSRRTTELKDGEKQTFRPRSLRTLKYYRHTLAMLFKLAQKWKWTGSNPVDGVNKITKLRNERVRYLSDKEREALLKACKASDSKQLYSIVVFALSTGARKGEIMNLTLADLDLSRNRATLRETKNGETRSVPIVPHLHDLLTKEIKSAKALYKELELKSQTQWLFPRPDGQEPIYFRKAWYNALEKAGVKDFRFHDLRHSTASYLAMGGATPLDIAAVLGHKTLQMVKRYAHLSETHTAAVVNRMSEKIFGTSK